MTIQAALPPMPTLRLNKEGKPPVPHWTRPPLTKMDLEWASLRTLDLSLLDGKPEQQEEAKQIFADSMENEGFLHIKNYGVPPDELQRIYDLANWTLNGDCLSEQDRKEYQWDFDHGIWKGYKPPFGWNEKGAQFPDSMEFYNWYGSCWENEEIPPKLRQYEDEILAYASHMYNQVARRIMILMSRALGMDDLAVWNQYAAKGHELPKSSYCRFQVVHPIPDGERDEGTAVLSGHTDYGTCTLIPAQPIACLQMCGKDGKWRYVPFEEGTLLANLGDVLECASGGIFKATRHRVIRPVEDQRQYERLSVISFNHAEPDTLMQPLMEAPLIKERGVNPQSGVYGPLLASLEPDGKPPTFSAWREQRKTVAQSAFPKVTKDGEEFYELTLGGVKILQRI